MESPELAARHIALREQAGLTQEQEAKIAGVSPTTISGIESGKITRPHLKTLLKIARALSVDVGELRESGKAEAPSSQPPLNGFEEERREDRVAPDAQESLDIGEWLPIIERFARYDEVKKTLDEFTLEWTRRLAEDDFVEAAAEEAGRTIGAFWPAVTALADSEMSDLIRHGLQPEEAAAQSKLVPAIARFQDLCRRVNDAYREKSQAEIRVVDIESYKARARESA